MKHQNSTDAWLVEIVTPQSETSHIFDNACDPVALAIEYAIDESPFGDERIVDGMTVDQQPSYVMASLGQVTVTVRRTKCWKSSNLSAAVSNMVETIKARIYPPKPNYLEA